MSPHPHDKCFLPVLQPSAKTPTVFLANRARALNTMHFYFVIIALHSLFFSMCLRVCPVTNAFIHFNRPGVLSHHLQHDIVEELPLSAPEKPSRIDSITRSKTGQCKSFENFGTESQGCMNASLGTHIQVRRKEDFENVQK